MRRRKVDEGWDRSDERKRIEREKVVEGCDDGEDCPEFHPDDDGGERGRVDRVDEERVG